MANKESRVFMAKETFIELLRRIGTDTEAQKVLGISRQYIGNIKSGRDPIGRGRFYSLVEKGLVLPNGALPENIDELINSLKEETKEHKASRDVKTPSHTTNSTTMPQQFTEIITIPFYLAHTDRGKKVNFNMKAEALLGVAPSPEYDYTKSFAITAGSDALSKSKITEGARLICERINDPHTAINRIVIANTETGTTCRRLIKDGEKYILRAESHSGDYPDIVVQLDSIIAVVIHIQYNAE